MTWALLLGDVGVTLFIAGIFLGVLMAHRLVARRNTLGTRSERHTAGE